VLRRGEALRYKREDLLAPVKCVLVKVVLSNALGVILPNTPSREHFLELYVSHI
jgi:hypothetical protein